MNNEQLAEIRKRAEAATPGEWYAKGSSVKTRHPDHQALSHWYNGTCNEVCSLSDGGEYIDNTNGDNDAEFIAHAREDVPKLLAEIERLKSALNYINELIGEFYTDEVEDGVFSIPDEEPRKSTLQEIAIISYEAVNDDDQSDL